MDDATHRPSDHVSWDPSLTELDERWDEREAPARPPLHKRLGSALEIAALFILCATLAILPWLSGGVIPLARLVLVAGAVGAMACTLLAQVCGWSRRASIPTAVMGLLGLAVVGCIQLLPIHASPADSMRHAVFAEYRTAAAERAAMTKAQATDPMATDESRGTQEMKPQSGSPQTTCPADTRSAVAQWLALALLMLVAYATVTSVPRLMACLAVLAINACAVTTVGLLQMFGDGTIIVGSWWKPGPGTPFGPFVNPNNASGWLCLGLALSLGLSVLVWSSRRSSGRVIPFGRASWQDRALNVLWGLRERISQLSSAQIVVLIMVILIVAGIATTLSRAGIVAAVVGLFACGASRLQWKHSLLLFVPLSLLVAASFGLLSLLDMDTVVVDELSTLQDPMGETTGRLLHWSDSLQSVRDFPWLGSGLRAYQYSTLPYQRHDFQKWFRHADNQFVEVLVESGILGFVLFCGVGVLALLAAVRLNRTLNYSVSAPQHPGHTRSWRLALAVIAVVAVSTQVVSAAFDFGIAMNSNSALLCALLGMVFVPFSWSVNSSGSQSSSDAANDVPPGDDHPPTASSRRSRRRTPEQRLSPGFLVLGLPAGLLMLLEFCVMLSAGAFLADLQSASDVYATVIDARWALRKPVSAEQLSRLPALQTQLELDLQERPDDPHGLAMRPALLEAQFRFALLESLAAARGVPVDEVVNLWEQLTPTALADRLLAMQTPESRAQRAKLVHELTVLRNTFPWHRAAEQVLERLPFQPGLAVDVIAANLQTPAPYIPTVLVHQVMFTEPANARRLYQLGYFSRQLGNLDQTRQCWQHAAALSDVLRPIILDNAVTHWSVEETLQLFGPPDYPTAVSAAQSVRSPELKQSLWALAEQHWQDLAAQSGGGQAAQLSELERRTRLAHLSGQHGDQAADAWLKACLAEDPGNLTLGLQRVALLQRMGKKPEALEEMKRLQFFHPHNNSLAAGIRRLEGEIE